jgi:hypothetical protein
MRRLFAGESEVETIKNVQGCIIKRPLQELNEYVDSDLNDIILKGLARDRKKRYETAAAMERDLMRYLARRYSEFSPQDLGAFVKKHFINRRQETQKNIHELLHPQQQPRQDSADLASDRRMNVASTAPIVMQIDTANLATLPLAIGQPSAHNSYRTSINARTSQISNNSQAMNAISRNPNSRHITPSYAEISTKKPMPVSIIGVFVTIATVIAVYLGVNWNSNDKYLQVSLSTQPRSVQLAIGGNKVEGGRYVETPKKITLAPGRYQLSIKRQGYVPVNLEISGKGGERLRAENIILRRDPNTAMISFALTSNSRVFASINNEEYRGYTPMTGEIAAGQEHEVTVFPEYPERKNAFKCTLRAPTDTNGITVMITPPSPGKPPRCVAK